MQDCINKNTVVLTKYPVLPLFLDFALQMQFFRRLKYYIYPPPDPTRGHPPYSVGHTHPPLTPKPVHMYMLESVKNTVFLNATQHDYLLQHRISSKNPTA